MIGNGMVANGIGAAQPVRKPFADSPDEGSRVSPEMTIVRVLMTATARPTPGARLVPFPDADPQPHMIDYDLVRAYYFDPPARNPHRVPSNEELIARYERRLFDHCVLRGGDPVAEGLGPHGSMIGGPGKPTTVHHCRVERTTPLDPLPLSWWAYPRAQLRILPPDGQQGAHDYLADLSGLYLAGIANHPDGPHLVRWINRFARRPGGGQARWPDSVGQTTARRP